MKYNGAVPENGSTFYTLQKYSKILKTIGDTKTHFQKTTKFDGPLKI